VGSGVLPVASGAGLRGYSVRERGLERTTLRRAQILEATLRAISERGVERTRLADVARSANVSIGLIQHYFESRDDLLATAFDFFNDLWLNEWESVSSAASDPPHKLAALLRFSAFEFEGWHEVHWRIWVEYWSLCNRNLAFRQHYRRIYDRFREPFRDIILEGIESGHFSPASPVEDIVDRLTAQIEGLRVHALLEPERVPRERMLELLLAEAEEELGFRRDDPVDQAGAL
jgi:TetR/AcrR family transcriptional repressor of bet genes